MASAVLFEDIFEVLVVDPDGKRFDKGKILKNSIQNRALNSSMHMFVPRAFNSHAPFAVSRFKCKGDLYEMDLTLDVNVELYPLEASPSTVYRIIHRQSSPPCICHKFQMSMFHVMCMPCCDLSVRNQEYHPCRKHPNST